MTETRPALLFDLDGTMLVTDPMHAAVFGELFAEHGREIDEAFYMEHIHGRLNAEIFAEHFPGEDGTALSEEKERRFRERLGERADPLGGLPALLDRAEAEGWAMAVVTNAPKENASAMLSAIGAAHRIGTVVIGDDLPRGKPAPDPYRIAMERLGVAPGQCLAFEDSRAGIASAGAAGALVVGMTTGLDAETLMAAGADYTAPDYTAPAVSEALARITG